MRIDSPPNILPHVGTLWAYLSKDSFGNEGLCAIPLGGTMMPMIAADAARLNQLTPFAEILAQQSGMTITLVEFTGRVEVRQITGRSS